MSDNAFIDLHEQMHTKGWIPDWEFNEAVDLYKYNNCLSIADCQSIDGGDYKSDIDTNGVWIYHLGSLIKGNNMFYDTNLASFSGDLSKLTDGQGMFHYTVLESFSGDLSSLTNGHYMFRFTSLTSFSGDLSNLTDGQGMFYNIPLESFNGDLTSLTYGNHMFCNSALTSFNGDLSSLSDGYRMFYGTALESFNGDLSSLKFGKDMFYNTHARTYRVFHYKMVNGEKTRVTETFVSNGLKSFNSDLSSLKSGYYMFGYSSTKCSPLSEESIMIIADTINDISTLNKSDNSDWKYTYYDGTSEITNSISYDYRGVLHLGYDASITDTTNIMNCCDKIADKGWKVYLNAAQQVANNGVIETISLTNEDGSPIPHYYKPVQVTDEDCAEFVDSNNNYYIIVGGQHVFGDDISSYGIFTSYEHAIEQISLGLGLTPCEKPDEVIIEE